MSSWKCPRCDSLQTIPDGDLRLGGPARIGVLCYHCQAGLLYDGNTKEVIDYETVVKQLRAEVEKYRRWYNEQRDFSAEMIGKNEALRAEVEEYKEVAATLQTFLDSKSAEVERLKKRLNAALELLDSADCPIGPHDSPGPFECPWCFPRRKILEDERNDTEPTKESRAEVERLTAALKRSEQRYEQLLERHRDNLAKHGRGSD